MHLKDYLEKNNISLAKFARRVDISWNTAKAISDGRDMRLSLAIRIQEFTKGSVTCQDLHNTFPKQLKLNTP